MPEENTADTPGISRRRILVGAAWTAPAIVLATAVPAVAASGPAKFTMTGSVNFTDRTLLADQISSGALTITNTGGVNGTPVIRFQFLGLGALNLLDPPPAVSGWTASLSLLDLGGGLGLLSTWVYTRNQSVAPGSVVSFAGFSTRTLLVGTGTGVRVTVAPPDTSGPNTIVDT